MSALVLKWTVEETEAGLLRDYLRTYKKISKRALADIKFTGGKLLVNGEEATVRRLVQQGDCVEVVFPEETVSAHMESVPMPLDILYEDDHLLIVNKPAGLPTIPSRYQKNGSLAQGILHYYKEIGLRSTFHAINRLDKDTSGLVMVAKHRFAHSLFSQQQREKGIHRVYLAYVHGKIENETGTVDAPIARDEKSLVERMVRPDGQRAVTHYRVLQRSTDHSAVSLQLETGRTHQIRVHMAYIGHPLVGDDLYGGRMEEMPRQALHSWKVTFLHPFTEKKMTAAAPLPADLVWRIPLPPSEEER